MFVKENPDRKKKKNYGATTRKWHQIKKMISKLYQKYKGEYRDYCCDFLVIFETTNKFSIAFVTMILGKKGVDRVTASRQGNDVRYEFDLKLILKVFRVQIEILAAIFD